MDAQNLLRTETTTNIRRSWQKPCGLTGPRMEGRHSLLPHRTPASMGASSFLTIYDIFRWGDLHTDAILLKASPPPTLGKNYGKEKKNHFREDPKASLVSKQLYLLVIPRNVEVQLHSRQTSSHEIIPLKVHKTWRIPDLPTIPKDTCRERVFGAWASDTRRQRWSESPTVSVYESEIVDISFTRTHWRFH